jgi:hypothetical protein
MRYYKNKTNNYYRCYNLDGKIIVEKYSGGRWILYGAYANIKRAIFWGDLIPCGPEDEETLFMELL